MCERWITYFIGHAPAGLWRVMNQGTQEVRMKGLAEETHAELERRQKIEVGG